MISGLQFVKALITSLLILFLVACDRVNQEPVASGFPAPTLLPALSDHPNTIEATLTPSDIPVLTTDIPPNFTSTFVANATSNLPIPSGKPVSSWKDIPIMPNAIVGEEKQDGYSYTTEATDDQVKDYYKNEMPKIGWEFFATGKGETGSLLLMYQKDGKTSTVSIFEQGNLTFVLLIQY